MAVFEKVQEIIVEELVKNHQKLLLSQLSMILKQIHLTCSKLSQKSKIHLTSKSKLKKV